MFTAVVQLYTTESPAHSHWNKITAGILCFIKDNSRRSYFLHVYCTSTHQLIWEQVIYNSMVINKTKPYLLSFEGDVSITSIIIVVID